MAKIILTYEFCIQMSKILVPFAKPTVFNVAYFKFLQPLILERHLKNMHNLFFISYRTVFEMFAHNQIVASLMFVALYLLLEC